MAAVALLIAAGIAWFVWLKPQPAARVTRFEIALPEGVQIDPTSFYVRVSPDGTKLAFTTSGETPASGFATWNPFKPACCPEPHARVAPFWSPDSRSIAFGLADKLMRVDVSGGPPQVLCTSATPVGSGFWTSDGEIVFGGAGPRPIAARVRRRAAYPRPVTALAQGELFHSLPSSVARRQALSLSPPG